MLRNGANGYVTKNSPSTEMVTAIDEVLAGKTYLCEEVGHLRPAVAESSPDLAKLRN
jgi:DNA-binding NarL/FixJ family response regulator